MPRYQTARRGRRRGASRVVAVTVALISCVGCVDLGPVTCSGDSDCADSDLCSNAGLCVKGCRRDNQCGSRRVCDSGTCVAGCHQDDQCPAGHVCRAHAVLNIDNEPGSCVPGCRGDNECAQTGRCRCQRCVENGCNTNDDCSEGMYCPTVLELILCTPTVCTPLPPSVQCGDAVCPPMVVLSDLDTMTLQPCCLPGDTGACGFDLGSQLTHQVACQAAAPAGSRDPTCANVPFASLPLPGCRRMDGTCGVLLDLDCWLAQ